MKKAIILLCLLFACKKEEPQTTQPTPTTPPTEQKWNWHCNYYKSCDSTKVYVMIFCDTDKGMQARYNTPGYCVIDCTRYEECQ